MTEKAVATEEDNKQYFELYKIMVASSETLVGRRQGVNTFFLTINGLLLTAVGLFVRGGGELALKAGGVCILAVTGLALCVAWRSLLISFGQLNTGKFVIIDAMESNLAASIFAAEWEALGRGEDRSVYRSFTKREADVPILLGIVFSIASVVSALLWAGVWSIGGA